MKYSDIVRARYEELKQQRDDKARGLDPRAIIPTGLKEYDKRAGLKRGQATLIAANSGEGKDLWMLHIITAAAKAGYSVEVVAPEDPPARTVDRSFSRETDINNAKMLNVDIDEKELARIGLAAADAEEWGELIDYHADSMTMDEAIELMDASDADLRVINYWQVFPGRRGESLEESIRVSSYRFNDICKRDGCAGAGFSQVNPTRIEERGQQRVDKSRWKNPDAPPDVEGFRPYGVSDLAWCTAAGIQAKDLQFLFRPGRYLKREGRNVEDNRMEITRPKNNFGAEGKVIVGVDLRTARFYDLPEKGK